MVVGHDIVQDLEKLIKQARTLKHIDMLEKLQENSYCMACVGYYSRIWKDKIGAPKKPKLSEWADFLKVPGRLSDFHDAQEDVKITRKIYYSAVKENLMQHPRSLGFQLINKIQKTSLKSKSKWRKSWCDESDEDSNEDFEYDSNSDFGQND